MNLEDFYKNVTNYKWFTILIVVGFLILGLSLGTELKGLTNQQGLYLGGALLCIGVGELSFTGAEWIDRVYLTKTVLVLMDTRKLTIHGIALYVLGIVLGVLFIITLF